jgi:hypothetical protein
VLGGLSVCLLVNFWATHDARVSWLSFLRICGGMWALVDLGSAGASASCWIVFALFRSHCASSSVFIGLVAACCWDWASSVSAGRCVQRCGAAQLHSSLVMDISVCASPSSFLYFFPFMCAAAGPTLRDDCSLCRRWVLSEVGMVRLVAVLGCRLPI